MYRESSTTELKQTVTSRYLKTVSAFSNYNGGDIIFGITDQGILAGLDSPVQKALDIENQINDNIIPQPQYEISVNEQEKTVTVHVFKGMTPPYYYKGTAYRRNDTSTIPVDWLELNRLILDGKNLEFGDLPCGKTDLSFQTFEKLWRTSFSTPFDNDLLKNLNLMADSGQITNTGLLLSDQNSFPGLAVVQFGDTINHLLVNEIYNSGSLLEQFTDGYSRLSSLLSYEEITGLPERQIRTRLPMEALREALVNAFAHRDWMLKDEIKVMIYQDRLEITSPGGLPATMSQEEYLYSTRSVPRNTTLTWVLLRLQWIEKLGTGTQRIQSAYSDSLLQPSFRFFDHSIQITLPFTDRKLRLSSEQNLLVAAAGRGRWLTRKEIDRLTGFSQSKTTRILRDLISLSLAEKRGNSRNTEYRLR